MTSFEGHWGDYAAPLRLCMIDGIKKPKVYRFSWAHVRQIICSLFHVVYLELAMGGNNTVTVGNNHTIPGPLEENSEVST